MDRNRCIGKGVKGSKRKENRKSVMGYGLVFVDMRDEEIEKEKIVVVRGGGQELIYGRKSKRT